MKENKPEPAEVTRIRKLLKAWDEHLLTKGEFELMVTDSFKDELFTLMRAGKDYGEMRPGCFNEKALPPVKIDVELELYPGGFYMRPYPKEDK